MLKTVVGDVELECLMKSDGEDVCFVVISDEKGEDLLYTALYDSLDKINPSKVKITIEQIK